MDKNNNKQVEHSQNNKEIVWGIIFGGLFFLTALVYLLSNFFGSLALIISAIFIFPPTIRIFREKWGIEFSKKGKIILGVICVIIFLFLSGKSGVETHEIKIEKGDSDPEEVVDATQTIINVVDDFQDAQLSTVALLSVKFETADKEDYLEYIKEIEDKWKKVEKSAKKLDDIRDKNVKIPSVSSVDSRFINIASADYPAEIDFGDAMSSDFNSDEVSLGDKEKQAFGGEIVEQAYAFKSLYPNGTSVGYLMDHLNITAKEANKMIAEYYGTVGDNWDDTATIYDAASKTASGIAYGSKVSLYVLGTVASFGSAAVAETGSGVILGYMGGAWGAALGGADIALDISEGASIVSTGKGLASYKKDKKTIGKLNTIFAIFNVGKMAATGIPKFNGNSFQVADDFMSVHGTGELVNNMMAEPKGDKLKIKYGKSLTFPKGTPIEEIVKEFHKPGFEYNEVALAVGSDEKGNVVVTEIESNSKSESCKSSNELVQHIESGENSLDVWWPACDKGFFSGKSCDHLENTCQYKDRCICKEGYTVATDPDGGMLTCIPNDDWMLLLSDGMAKAGSSSCRDAIKLYKEWGKSLDLMAPCDPNYESSEEVKALEKKLADPKLINLSKKARTCDL